MSKNRKKSEPNSVSKRSKTPSPAEYVPELDADLQRPYPSPLAPSEKPSETSAKPASVVEPRKLTPEEVESLLEDMEKVGEQVKGRSRHLLKDQKSPRLLTPSEVESLREDMKEAGRQAKGRFYLENGKVRIRPKKD